MFSPVIIKARLNEKPFRPLRILASEGLSYDVSRPNFIWAGWNDLQFGFAHADHLTICDRTIRFVLSHVVGIDDVPSMKS